jgi:hypothetical protein
MNIMGMNYDRQSMKSYNNLPSPCLSVKKKIPVVVLSQNNRDIITPSAFKKEVQTNEADAPQPLSATLKLRETNFNENKFPLKS